MLQPVDDLCLHLSAWGIAGKVLSPHVGHRQIDVSHQNSCAAAQEPQGLCCGSENLPDRSTRPQHGLAMHVGFVLISHFRAVGVKLSCFF